MEYELQHHGIKGMRWGVRRFQNKDGSLTSAGKKRASQDDAEDKKPKKQPKKRVKDMSDAELQARIRRLQMEKQYKELNGRSAAVQGGKQFAKDVVKQAGKSIATQTLTYLWGTAVNEMWKEVTGLDENIVNPKKGQKDK